MNFRTSMAAQQSIGNDPDILPIVSADKRACAT
jgi:hypothetical protein